MSVKNNSTKTANYAQRLTSLENKKWKQLFNVQAPYRWNLKRLKPGKTLDIGCGIGRNLKHLPLGSVGLDHNQSSINIVNQNGMIGFLPGDFTKSKYNRVSSFDSILLSHVLEHMRPPQAVSLIKQYLQLLKKDGRVIVFCPQRKGYKSDQTHVTFLDFRSLESILLQADLLIIKKYSYPLPKAFGRMFKYNEFVIVGQKNK